MILTIQFALYFTLQDYNWKKAIENVGFESSAVAESWMLDIFFFITISSITCSCMSMVTAVLLLLVNSEMSQPEFEDYISLLGSKVNAGFGLFFAGIVSFAFECGVLAFLLTETWGGRMLTMSGCGLIVGLVVIIFYTPIVHSLYVVKLKRLNFKKDEKLYGPLVYSAVEVKGIFEQFKKDASDVEFIGAENFKAHCELQGLKTHGYTAKMADLTRMRVERVVSDYFEEQLRKDFEE